MPRFYFDIKNGHRLVDPSGLDCADADQAISKAKTIARQIAQETSGEGGQRHIAILDSQRREVSKVPVHLPIGRAAE
jgi:hypothetical protein